MLRQHQITRVDSELAKLKRQIILLGPEDLVRAREVTTVIPSLDVRFVALPLQSTWSKPS